MGEQHRRRSPGVGLGAVTLIASLFTTACGQSKDPARVCVDDRKVVREDRDCERRSSSHVRPYGWYYLPAGTSKPAKGTTASGGSTNKAEVARGGFGGRSGSGSSGG